MNSRSNVDGLKGSAASFVEIRENVMDQNSQESQQGSHSAPNPQAEANTAPASPAALDAQKIQSLVESAEHAAGLAKELSNPRPSDIDWDKVRAAKAALARGDLRPKSGRIADAMLGDARERTAPKSPKRGR